MAGIWLRCLPRPITLTLAGREDGDTAEFEGTALQVPGVAFRAVLSRISD
ncbi:hypothetical protein [Bradyrhizobium sp. 21]|nr:hypothetical protein [Bradyrhizobium sp. 21]MCK1386901.1 hypothetical protein [Bradyrhizobium sp. 21]